MSTHLPAVERDESSAPFFEAASRGELAVKRGATSGAMLPPEARTDPATGSSDLTYHSVSGRATLVSWTVVHRAPLPALSDSVPYVSAIVELDEGPWLVVRLLTEQPDRLHAGDQVQVRCVPTGDEDRQGDFVPVFEPQN